MKLVLYSGGFSKDNQALAVEVGDLLRGKRQPLVAFVPGNAEDADCDFRDFKRTVAPSGLKRFVCIPVDKPLTGEDEATLLAADAIFLGGGNTFYLLHHLREKKLLGKLRAFVRDGGILMGLSAGSILMTPNVMTAEVPSLDCDENDIGVKDYSALGLVPFEFSPHYRGGRRVDAELLDHSKRSKNPIYACKDGEGIVVRDGTIRFVGRVTVFHRGNKYNLQ
jgi:dipeptidase E